MPLRARSVKCAAMMVSVQGEILFESSLPAFNGVTLYVRLLDVSRLDATSKTIAEQVIRDVAHVADSVNTIEFELNDLRIDERARYIVTAHADVDGDGRISRGDLMTMESYPVLTFGNPARVSVRVKKV